MEKRCATCGQMLAKADPWFKEKRNIEKFYKKFFNRKVNWSKVVLPAKNAKTKRLEYVFKDISAEEALKAYAKKFGKNSVWKAWKNIDKAIKKQQVRPNSDYVICHVGGDEPDMLGKSYKGINKKIKIMIPVEGIIAAFRHRIRTGRMYDVKGMTYFAALDSDDSSSMAIIMCKGGDDQLRIGCINRGFRHSVYGFRQVSF